MNDNEIQAQTNINEVSTNNIDDLNNFHLDYQLSMLKNNIINDDKYYIIILLKIYQLCTSGNSYDQYLLKLLLNLFVDTDELLKISKLQKTQINTDNQKKQIIKIKNNFTNKIKNIEEIKLFTIISFILEFDLDIDRVIVCKMKDDSKLFYNIYNKIINNFIKEHQKHYFEFIYQQLHNNTSAAYYDNINRKKEKKTSQSIYKHIDRYKFKIIKKLIFYKINFQQTTTKENYNTIKQYNDLKIFLKQDDTIINKFVPKETDLK